MQGTVFEIRGEKYKIQKITEVGVHASKVINGDKCQKGRPSKFSFEEVAKILNTSVEALKSGSLKEGKTVLGKEIVEALESVRYDLEGDGPKDNTIPSPATVIPTVKPTVKKVLSKEELKAKKIADEERSKKISEYLDIIDDKSSKEDWEPDMEMKRLGKV